MSLPFRYTAEPVDSAMMRISEKLGNRYFVWDRRDNIVMCTVTSKLNRDRQWQLAQLFADTLNQHEDEEVVDCSRHGARDLSDDGA